MQSLFRVTLPLHDFENPALPPRPNRTLGGTNCNADMAPVRSAMSASTFFFWGGDSFTESEDSGLVSLLMSFDPAS